MRGPRGAVYTAKSCARSDHRPRPVSLFPRRSAMFFTHKSRHKPNHRRVANDLQSRENKGSTFAEST